MKRRTAAPASPRFRRAGSPPLPNRVTVLAVVHGRRDFESISPKPWE